MTQKIIQDIVKKRPERKNKLAMEMAELMEPPKKKSSKKIFWFFLGFTVLFAGALILNYASSAVINIVPCQKFAEIDSQFNAGRDYGDEELSFEIVRLENENIENAPSTGVDDGGKRAGGKIVIYNTYSSKSQILVAQTRFESPEGKIYRIEDRVSVPGMGSLEVDVYADEPGPEYNIGFVDFTIPGFKGSPQYDKIYARSKTSMSGGAVGVVSIITEDDISLARENLRKKITDYLEQNISAQKSDNYLFYKNAIKINFSESENNPKAGDTTDSSSPIFTLKGKGEAVGFLINKDELTKVLINEYLAERENKNVKIVNLEDLEFTLLSSDEDNTKITFKLKGKAHFVCNIDASSLISALASSDDENYESIFGNYPGVERAEVFFKPSWWQSMPKKESRIRVEIIYGNL